MTCETPEAPPEVKNTPSRLITRADDFGISPGTNEAILECLDAGFVRNVGVMAPAPSLHHRLEELIARQEECCLGLHATLNSEWAEWRWGPVLPPESVSSLVGEDGTFHATTALLHERGQVDEMVREVEAQLAKLVGLGLRPRYLDTHMVFSWIEGVADALEELCRREGLVFANSSGFCDLPLRLWEQPDPKDIHAAIRSLAQSHPGARPVSVFHPAKLDSTSALFFRDPTERSGGIGATRHSEYLALSNAPILSDWAACANIRPATYLSAN